MSSLPLITYPLGELVAAARAGSPFYREFYRGLPEHPSIADIPILEQQSYWEPSHRDKSDMLTGEPDNGIVIFSGGSTGAPKFSFFTDQEWRSSAALSAQAFEATGVADGDRAANLFAPGLLYASFLLATESLREMRPKVLQFPMGYFMPVPDIVRYVQNFRINVLVGLPSHILNIIDHLDREQITDVHFTRLLYAGEPFTPDQRAFVQGRFPGVQVRSVGYASVDAGMMALADETCGPGEHRLFDQASIFEIVDEETGEVIEEVSQPGRIIFTNLTRRLMPMIRYPSGDRGQWVEPPGGVGRKFLLLGRSEEAARLSFVNFAVSDFSVLLQPFREKLSIRQFQVLVTHHDRRDQLTLRLVGHGPSETLEEAGREIVASLFRARPLLEQMVTEGVSHPVQVDWIEARDLIVTPRTGKVRMVVDQRVSGIGKQ